MQGKVAEVIGLIASLVQWTVGNPDALSMEIHHAGRRLADRFLGTSSGKERSVEDGHCRFPIRIGNGHGEDAGILVVHAVELDAFIRAEGREPQTLPVEQVLREGQGNPRAFGRKRRVSHHVTLEVFAKSNPRILTASAAVRPQLVIRFGLQCDAEPLDARRVAGLIELHSCDADARVIPLRDQTREEVKLTIRAANPGRVQDPFDLQRIARLGLHHHPKPLHLKSSHHVLSSQRSRLPDST